MNVLGILSMILLSSASTEAPPAHGAIVEQVNGRSVIVVDGEPMAPLVYALTEGGRFTWGETPSRNLRNFAEQGFRLFQIDVWFRDIWAEDETLDMATVCKQIRGVLEACPDALIFIRLHVDAPPWWTVKYPEECVQYASGPVDEKAGDTGRARRNSLASQPWRAQATNQLRAFCRSLSDSPEGNCVIGLHLAGGVYGEWHYWGFPEEPDTGQAMTHRFRAWLVDTYGTEGALRAAWRDESVSFTTAAVPGMALRERTCDGMFRQPAAERPVIDYGRCHQENTADVVLHFCRVAKESWPRPLVTGAFYGYFFYMYDMVSGGHLELERVLDSPHIDYLSAPFSYELSARSLGGTGHLRCLTESISLHGKLWLSELDHATHLGDVFGNTPPYRQITPEDSVAVMRRNVAQSLLRGHGLWWYDFGPKGDGGWWDCPELLAEVKDLKARGERMLARPHRPVADVLYVYDTECFYYLGLPKPGMDPFSRVAVNDSLVAAYHTGAMIDTVLLSDLPLVDLDRYRVVVFAHTPLLRSDVRTFVRDRVQATGRTVVFIHAPGYTDGENLSLDRLSETVGMKMVQASLDGVPAVVTSLGGLSNGRYSLTESANPMFAVDDEQATALGKFEGTTHVALARIEKADHTIWYSALPLTNADVLRTILREAGAHIYVDTGDVVLATADTVCIHSVDGGSRALRLPGGGQIETVLPPRSTTFFDLDQH